MMTSGESMRGQGNRLVQQTVRKNCMSILLAAASFGMTYMSDAAASGAASVAPVGRVASRARCGANDRIESGVQGQITLTERFSLGKFREFNCNLELTGQTVDHGATKGFVITDKCAYFSKWYAPELPTTADTGGVVVVDVADSSSPKLVKTLKTPAMFDANDSLAGHLGRNLLVAQRNDSRLEMGKTFEIYDVTDCTNPVLKFSGIIPGFILHDAEFTRDGSIIWASSGPDKIDAITALDITDVTQPKVLARWTTPTKQTISRFHGLSVSDDGNTLYATIGRHFSQEKKSYPSQGMGMFNVSEVNARKPDAKITMIGAPLFWTDVGHNQYVVPVTIKGRKYVWETDIDGAIPTYDSKASGREYTGALASRAYVGPEVTPEQACSTGQPPWGYVSLIDIEDPQSPKRVAAVRLEVSEPKNCLAVAHDPVYSSQGYAAANCDVDNHQDARMMVCAYGEAGVRVFDIRNIHQPREIAYYKPPAVGSEPRLGSQYRVDLEPPQASLRRRYHTGDSVASAFFAKGGKEIWFTSYDNGFQVVRFSDELIAREKELFNRDNTCGGKLRGRYGCTQ
jgi:hypothetical protein